MQAERKRPTGLTIVAILLIIVSIFCLIVGILSIVTATVAIPFLAQVSEDIKIDSNQSSDFNSTDITTALNEIKGLSAFSGFFLLVGTILIPFAIAGFIVSWGLLKGKGWALIGAIILIIISILLRVIIISMEGMGEDAISIGGNLVVFIIQGLILWYLFRPNVRSYFGVIRMQAP